MRLTVLLKHGPNPKTDREKYKWLVTWDKLRTLEYQRYVLPGYDPSWRFFFRSGVMDGERL